MSMRVSQRLMFNTFTGNINKNLSDLMESNLQSSSQLKINRPSDDPAGAGRVISLRASISRLSLYDSNIQTAKGWLATADSVLTGEGSVQSVLSNIKTLAQQGATGTYTSENRLQISYELRQNFMQLINLANTSYNGKSVFAGHKTDQPAYREGLGITSNDQSLGVSSTNGSKASASGAFAGTIEVSILSIASGVVSYQHRSNGGAWSNPLTTMDNGAKTELKIPGGSLAIDTASGTIANEKFTVIESKATGGASSTVLFQATSSGPAESQTYRCSTDGGSTWDYNVGLSIDGDKVTISSSGVATTINKNSIVSAVDPDNSNSTDNGTWIYIRPTAIYQGDTHGSQVTTGYGASTSARADGFFSQDVSVKITSTSPEVTYAYSINDGSTWTSATAVAGATKLAIPGGFLSLDSAPVAGNMFTVHPHRADINFNISDTDSMTVNLVGKDVFGGLYTDPATGDLVAADNGSAANLFEVVGRLVGYAEIGSQHGMQLALAELGTVMGRVLTNAALVGGRENRLEVTEAAVTTRKLDETDNLSQLEDVDISVLMTQLAQQQVAYNSVLKSSSMIMQMSLLNYL